MLKKCSYYLDKLENAAVGMGCLLIVFSMLSVVLEVVSTSLFNYSLLWVNEVSEYILLYLPFLGAAYLLREKGHITIDILEHYVQARYLYYLDVIVLVLCTLMSLCLVIFSVKHTIDTFQRGLTSMTLLEIPQVYVVAVIPYGSALLCSECIRQLYQCITNFSAPVHSTNQ